MTVVTQFCFSVKATNLNTLEAHQGRLWFPQTFVIFFCFSRINKGCDAAGKHVCECWSVEHRERGHSWIINGHYQKYHQVCVCVCVCECVCSRSHRGLTVTSVAASVSLWRRHSKCLSEAPFALKNLQRRGSTWSRPAVNHTPPPPTHRTTAPCVCVSMCVCVSLCVCVCVFVFTPHKQKDEMVLGI